MSAFFAPAIGNSTVRVVSTSTPQSVLIGVGGNAVRCVSDGSGGVPREHDSVYHISSSASIANVVMFQSGEV